MSSRIYRNTEMIMVGENDTEWQQLQLQRQADLSKMKTVNGIDIAATND